MSGDVQPRKRKDKRRKKEGGSLGMIHEPVGSQKFKRSESEDQKIFDLPDQGEKIHVQNEHGVGGNICVKIIFFCLLGLLVGAVGLIYMKSQGSSDVDLPTIEESRFADYFTGWLDDNTDEHEHEHVTSENDVDHDHDDHDNHEDVDEEEENEHDEEEDHSAEQDAIFKLFGVEEDAIEEFIESNVNDKEPESEEDSGIERDVNEDEENEDESGELKEEEKEKDDENESEELKEEDENDDEDEEKDDNEEEEDDDDDDGDEGNEDVELKESKVKENDEEFEDADSDEVKEGGEDGEDNEGDDSFELEQQDDDDDDEKQINKLNEDDSSPDVKEIDEEDEEDEETSKEIHRGKNKIDFDDDEDEDEDEEEEEINSKNNDNEEKSNENDGEEEEEDKEEDEDSERLKTDEDIGYEEIDVSEEDLDEEPAPVIEDKSEEAAEESTSEEVRKLKSENVESEITKEEEETEFDAGGVAIKLGVGIALVIVAHLVLVQKWKSVSNAASNENASLDTATSEGKKEENDSTVEPVISRRQTLVPESVFLNGGYEDEENMGDEYEEEDEDDGEEEEEEGEEEDVEENKDEEECCEEPEFEETKKSNRSTFSEPFPKVKAQEIGDEDNGDLIENEEYEEEEEDDNYDDEEEEQDDDIEEGEEEEEEEDEMEDDYDDDEEDDDEMDGKNDFRKQKTPPEYVEEMPSREESIDSTPIPPPRARRDGRGTQDVDEDPLSYSEELGEVEETSRDYPKEDETAAGPDPNLENEKTPEMMRREDEWSFRQELDVAEEQFENNPKAAVEAYNKVLWKKPTLTRALIGRARALDHLAEKEKSNSYLKQAIEAYKTLLLQHGGLLNEETYVKLAERCIERMRFAGSLISAIEVHKALIMKHPNTPKYRNMLAVTYLMMNKIPQARVLLNETLALWPGNGFALVHYGFILKTSDGDMEGGARKLMAGIETKEEGVINGMFFFHLGDALHRLGREKEAMEWYELGVKEGLFLSKYQRSLYNVNRLKGQPWWTKEDTTYQEFFKKLENNWREIRREGLELFNAKGINLFKEEAENLKDTGDWKQLDLYFRGKKTPSCSKAPITCSLVSSFQPAATCTRGQVKFSVMLPNTHVWPHCGPTNCRLRSHLGLVVPKHTFIRVAEETRSWEEGKFIIFDDSFEHEVWHNGTGPRLVLIVDVWHPELTGQERRQLSPI